MNNALKRTFSTGLTLALAAGLSACGGSSSSGSSAPQTETISGIVTDPAISGAQVRLDNAQGTALAQIVVTDDNGRFSFSNVPAAQLDGAVLTASGGTDEATGIDFTGVSLQAVIQDSDSQIVSPLTSLIVEDMEANGSSYDAALANIAQLTGIDSSLLSADPTTDAALQKISLQLSLMAEAVKTLDDFGTVYTLLSDNGTDWADISNDVQIMDVADSIKARFADLQSELANIDAISSELSAAETLNEANRLSMIAGVEKFLSEQLAYTAATETAETNVVTLAEALWNANGQKGLSTDSAKFANLVRYVFNVAGITTADLDDAGFALSDDVTTNIASIAELDVIDHRIPLADGEFLSTSDEKRAYFYNSDLAPTYKVQQLYSSVQDSNAIDVSFSRIVRSYVVAGMKDEADVILNSQISSPFYLAMAYQQAGRGFYEIGDDANGLAYLDIAASNLTSHMENKGWAYMDGEDADQFLTLSTAYRNQGEDIKADNLLAPVEDFIDANSGTYSTAYGRIGTAISKQAEALIETAEAADLSAATVAEALVATDFYAALVDGYGLQAATSRCGDHYMLKAFSLTSVIEYYARLEQPAKTREAINKFVDLRAGHACTSQRTDSYVRYLAPAYGYLDDIDGFLSMAESTIQSSSYLTRAQNAAALYIALNQAKAGNVEDAIATITAQYPDDTDAGDLEDRLELLTNGGIQEKGINAFLAVKLFNEGYTAAGAEVLTAAWNIATSETYINGQTDDGSQLMYYGCSKIARMTYQNVDQAAGQTRMQTCANIAEDFESTGATMAVSAAYTYLSKDALLSGLDSLGVDAFHSALSYAGLLSGEDAAEATRNAISFPVDAGVVAAGAEISDLTGALNDLKTLFTSALSAAATEEEEKDAGYLLLSTIGAHADVINGLRKHAEQNGPMADQSQVINNLQTSASALLPQLFDVATGLSDVDDTSDLVEKVYDLGNDYGIRFAGLFTEMASLIDDMAEYLSGSELNSYRAALTKHILKLIEI